MNDPYEKKPERSEPASLEIEEEFLFHMESAERDGRAAGLAENDARENARAAFGDVSSHRDACLRVAQPWSNLMCKTTSKWAFAATWLAIGLVAGLVLPELLDDVTDSFTDTEWKRVGAFDGVVWQGETPVVLVEDQWYVLDAINGREIDGFLEATQARFGEHTQKRFKEDLYEVLQALGEPTDAIDATLRHPVSGELVEKRSLELTEEKRDRAYSDAWRERADLPPVPAPSDRDTLSTSPEPDWPEIGEYDFEAFKC